MSEPVSESSLHILRIYANAAGGIFPARRGILREIPYGKGVYRLATAFFRTIILYLLLIAGLRLSGKRQIGELEPIELVLTLLISDLASVPMQDFGLPLLNGVVPILALIALSTLFSCASLRNVRFRSLVCGEPALVIRDGRIRQEVDQVTAWLTGYTPEDLARLEQSETSYGDFFRSAPAMNPNRTLITGKVCGIRVEEIEDPLMREIRYLDKLVDELAKGKPMVKILRT